MGMLLHPARIRPVAFVFAIVLGLAASVPAPAQSAEANLRGTAPAGATVTARNEATGLTRRTTVSPDGSYVIVGLPAGTYRVDAGAGTETEVTLAVASTATLALGPAIEEVTVTAQRGVARTEVRTSEVGFVVSLHEIQNTPQVTRNFLEFADMVPGIQFSVDANGNTTFRGGAQTTSSINVFIDGVGQKSYVKDGGITGQVQTQGNPFPQLAIGSYKVITSNYKAEYDQVSSAAVTAETKSGTNEFHGEVFTDFTNQGLRKMTSAEEIAGVKTESRDNEYGFAFGGPIVRDVAHFFVTYEGKRFRTPASIFPSFTTLDNGQPLDSILPADLVAKFGPVTRPFDSDLYFGKIDFEPGSADRFEFSAKVRKDTQANFGSGSYAPEHGTTSENTDTRLVAKWQHATDRWTNELLFTWEDAFFKSRPRIPGNGAIYDYYACPDANNCSPGQYWYEFFYAGSAGPLDTQDKGQRGPGLQDDLTIANLSWHGDHTLKMGMKYKAIDLKAIDAGGQGPQFYYTVTDAGVAPQPYYLFFGYPTPGQSPVVNTKDKQLGVYFQDDWSVTKRLTLNLGLRWDTESVPAYLNYVTPQKVYDGMAAQDTQAAGTQSYAETLAKGGIDINRYLSNGHSRHAPTNEWQPRLGFSFDINEDQHHVVFGGFGRSYDRDLFDYLQLENNKGALPQYTVAFKTPVFGGACYPGVPCFDWDPAYLNGPAALAPLAAGASPETDLLPNNLRVPYSDQFSVGMRNRVGAWYTSVALSNVHSKDGFVFSWGNREPDGSAYNVNCMNGNSCNPIPGLGLLILGDNGAETKTTQVLMSLEKPYSEESGWGTSISYTYSNARSNIDGHYASEYANIRDYPFLTSSNVPKSRLVATGSVRAGWGVVIGAKLTLASPMPIMYDGQFPTPTNSSWYTPVSLTPSGTIGYRSLDLQFTKNIRVGEGRELYVRCDAINVFNAFNPDSANGGYTIDYGDWSRTTLNEPVPNRGGNIVGKPFSLKLSAGFRF